MKITCKHDHAPEEMVPSKATYCGKRIVQLWECPECGTSVWVDTPRPKTLTLVRGHCLK